MSDVPDFFLLASLSVTADVTVPTTNAGVSKLFRGFRNLGAKCRSFQTMSNIKNKPLIASVGIVAIAFIAWLAFGFFGIQSAFCLLYTSPSPRDQRGSRMPSSA